MVVSVSKTVKRPPQQPAQPQYANYWAPLTRKWHILPHPAQPQHTNHLAPRTRKRTRPPMAGVPSPCHLKEKTAHRGAFASRPCNTALPIPFIVW